MTIKEQAELSKINIIKKSTLDTLNLTEHPNEIFGITDESEYAVDSELNANSENPVQNRVLYNPVVFAEAERQKSKNLFDLNRVHFSGEVTIDNANNSFTIAGDSTWTNNLKDFADLEVGKTYTLSANNSANRNQIYLVGSNSYWNFGEAKTITEADLNNGIGIYGTTSSSTIVSNVQIEEGSIATDYQSYNGAIVHEKELNKRNITLLWENARANVYEEFNPQTITLPNSDYDCLIVLWSGVSQDPRLMSTVIYKGKGAFLNWAYEESHTYSREVNYTNDTTLTCNDAKIDANTVDNVYCVPYKILGFKLN